MIIISSYHATKVWIPLHMYMATSRGLAWLLVSVSYFIYCLAATGSFNDLSIIFLSSNGSRYLLEQGQLRLVPDICTQIGMGLRDSVLRNFSDMSGDLIYWWVFKLRIYHVSRWKWTFKNLAYRNQAHLFYLLIILTSVKTMLQSHTFEINLFYALVIVAIHRSFP